MADLRGNRGRFIIWIALAVLTVTVISVPGYLAHRAGALNNFLCEGECPVEFAVQPPEVMGMKPAVVPVTPPNSRAVDKTALESAVAEPLSDPALGPGVGFVAVDAQTGGVLISKETDGHTPASTTKVLAAWGVLAALGPDHRFETQVKQSGDTLYLVGGGDPYLMAERTNTAWAGTSLDELADRVAHKVGTKTAGLVFDESLFTGPEINPSWLSADVPRYVEPITPLNARNRMLTSRTPSTDTARRFEAALNERGVTVTSVTAGVTPNRAKLIASGQSAPLRDTAAAMIAFSDNTAAEILLRHTAIGQNQPASFEGGVKAVTTLLNEASLPTTSLVLADGSGMSRNNQISPLLLTDLLTASLNDDRFTALVTGMPVSGLNGSLMERFDFAQNARGVVRAKTGTLTGVSALAGWANLPDGRTVVFAIMADQINGYPLGPPQDAVDRVAAAIATCAC